MFFDSRCLRFLLLSAMWQCMFRVMKGLMLNGSVGMLACRVLFFCSGTFPEFFFPVSIYVG